MNKIAPTANSTTLSDLIFVPIIPGAGILTALIPKSGAISARIGTAVYHASA